MVKLVLELLGKSFIGMLKIAIIFYIIFKICNYVGKLYGDVSFPKNRTV
jgi:hypothetical protein